MSKLFIVSLVVISSLGLTPICKAQNAQLWDSMNPLSIPIKIREKYYKKGNLVPNPSFEKAHIFKNDSTITNFKLSGWSVIGKNIQLTDITHKGAYNKTDAFMGNHAIKISRKPNSVKNFNNPTPGVLSNYIKVIPGNYNFTFYIRLKNIFPSDYPNKRFEQRVGKMIDTHIQYYDKDKKPINPGIYFEYINKKVNNSFKGFSFSNYFYIKKFKWGKVHGKTWSYPFSVGDLPNNVKYIRIFFGLKGSGTMWIDNVNYHLSRWNFTTLERMHMRSMFSKKYDLTDLMIPTPQLIKKEHHIDLKSKNIAIIFRGTKSPGVNRALEMLQNQFNTVNKIGSANVYSIHKSEYNRLPSNGLKIILINKWSPVSAEFKKPFNTIKNKEQGYFTRRKGNKIYIGANTATGLYYGACSLSQLLDKKHSFLDYADITDWPDFKGRSTRLLTYKNNWTINNDSSLSNFEKQKKISSRNKKIKKQLKEIGFYAFYKINYFYNSYFSLSKRWWEPGKFYKVFYNKIGSEINKYGDILHLAVQVNPTYHLSMESQESALSDSLRNLFSYGTKAGFNKIKHVLKPALEAGARTVMICQDDFVPHAGPIRGVYSLFTRSDKQKFINLAGAHSYLLNELQSWLNNKYGNVHLEFVPPPYNNLFINYSRGNAYTYFRDLNSHLDSTVVLVWTGNTIRSLSYDMADIHKALKVYKRKPMIWDNSQYARYVETKNGGYPINYPKKAVMCNIFQPFDIRHPQNFSTYLNSPYYNNLGGFSETNKVQYMTFADFSWNTKDYDPLFSLYKALVHYVGRSNAKKLLKFSDSYYRFVSTWGQLNLNLKRHPAFILSHERRKKAKMQIKNMKSTFSDLQTIDNDVLKKELENKMNAKIREWQGLVNKASKNRK